MCVCVCVCERERERERERIALLYTKPRILETSSSLCASQIFGHGFSNACYKPM